MTILFKADQELLGQIILFRPRDVIKTTDSIEIRYDIDYFKKMIVKHIKVI